MLNTPTLAETIPITEVFYGNGRQVFEQGIYVIATETNPVEMYPNYTNKKAYYEMLREHMTTEASSEQFISILVSRGICPSSGYSVGIESIEKIGSDFVLSANFTEPGWGCIVFWWITNPVALIPIGNLSDGEYSITLHIDSYVFSCRARSYFYLGTATWTTSFRVLDPASDPAPDLYVEATSVWWHECPLIAIGHVYSVYVNVTNQGTADAGSFNVSFSTYWEYSPEVPELWEKKTVTSLEQGVTESMQFDFSVMNYGNYTIVVMADCDTAVAELDEINNVKTEWVLATVLGDIDGDGDVDPFDYSRFRRAYGSRCSEPNYDFWCDFDRDCDVDAFDFAILRVNYGAHLPPF